MSDTLAARYDTEAGGWHKMLRRLGYDAAYDQLCDAASGLGSASTILDAGCGSGALSLAARRAGASGARFTLLDPSAKMLADAAKRLAPAAPDVMQMKVEGLLDHAGQYDAILCAHVIEHCDDPVLALRAMRSVLAPGGVLALSVSKPHWCTAIVRWKWGSKAYHEAAVHDMLTTAGFSDITSVPYVKGPPSRTSKGYVAYANNNPTP